MSTHCCLDASVGLDAHEGLSVCSPCIKACRYAGCIFAYPRESAERLQVLGFRFRSMFGA